MKTLLRLWKDRRSFDIVPSFQQRLGSGRYFGLQGTECRYSGNILPVRAKFASSSSQSSLPFDDLLLHNIP
jgi:hypothetical protein